MEFNFRLILIIISAIIIVGIYFHGRSKIRKGTKNPYKLKASKAPVESEYIEEESRNFDHEGFDNLGVSKPKPVILDDKAPEMAPQVAENTPPVISEEQVFEQMASKEEIEQLNQQSFAQEPDLQQADFDNEHADSTAVENDFDDSSDTTRANSFEDDLPPMSALDIDDVSAEPLVNSVEEPKAKPELEPIYEAPVSKPKAEQTKVEQPKFETSKPSNVESPTKSAKPKTAPIKSSAVDKVKTQPVAASSKKVKKNQLEMDFDNVTSAKKPKLEQEVIALSVVVNDDQVISGAALLPTFLTLGLKFGEMNIFHRHQDNAGNGKVTFSVANMVNPGTFDLDNMETFTTKGITLFMTLPNAGEPAKVFKQMLSAAKQVAEEVGGQVLDGQRSMMTKQTEQHYKSKILEFDRKARLAGY